MKTTAMAAFAVAIMLLVLSPGRSADAPARSEFHHSYPLAATGTVSIDDDRGDIHVVGWSANRVQVDATLTAPSSHVLAEMKIKVDSSPTAMKVQTIYPRLGSDQPWWQLWHDNGPGNSMAVRYTVHVPAGARIRLSTQSADVVARGLTARFDARTTSGDIQAQDVGDVTLSSVSGDVTVVHGRGTYDVGETSGRTVLQDVAGTISSQSVSGKVDLDRVAGKAVVTTTAGDITAHAYRGVARLRSVSGDVEVTLVRGSGVSVSASSVHGDIQSDVPLRQQAPVDVQTVSGDITAKFL
ncbi:MAG: DUF4097 family beta strand repeat protein [Candidatus Eremiobacteraeota bacterium]|nr:DUF4097 family beta strand repeat protein [Candidatus Eremiobacteraeota bacterium]